MKTTELLLTTADLIPTMTTGELLAADAEIGNGLDTPGLPAAALKSMLSDRKAVRAELTSRHIAAK
jgi:hypothetical protein